MKLAVLFGGSSNEHEVSVVSACSIIKNLDKNKYDITPIYLDKKDDFYFWRKDINEIEPMEIGVLPTSLEKIEEPFLTLKNYDCVFLMIHGKNGEDGILASILEFLHIPYVGNKPAPSIITMDKIYTKDILECNHIKTSKYQSFMKYNDTYMYDGKSCPFDEVLKQILEKLSFPMFVKPANSGSSIGVGKANDLKELEKAIQEALRVDERILVEEMVVGKEVECAILERGGKVEASLVGEVLASDDFYSFDAKYKNSESKTVIPANIDEEDSREIRDIAKKAFQILNLHSYSRIDFFLTSDHQVILNEINTIPGFTEISMYPKLWEATGVSYSNLLDSLIVENIKK